MSEGYAGGMGGHGAGGAGRKSDRDAAHAIGPAPAPRADLFLERGDVSVVPPTADRQLYDPRIMGD
jgi:hypothetical protein